MRLYLKRFFVFFVTFFLLISEFVPYVYAASSPWSTSDNFSLTNTEKLTNTGFETDLTNWTSGETNTFHDASFLTSNGAVSAWPLDDTTSTQSFSRVLNPGVATGRNIVLDPGFDDGTKWTQGTGWSV